MMDDFSPAHMYEHTTRLQTVGSWLRTKSGTLPPSPPSIPAELTVGCLQSQPSDIRRNLSNARKSSTDTPAATQQNPTTAFMRLPCFRPTYLHPLAKAPSTPPPSTPHGRRPKTSSSPSLSPIRHSPSPTPSRLCTHCCRCMTSRRSPRPRLRRKRGLSTRPQQPT